MNPKPNIRRYMHARSGIGESGERQPTSLSRCGRFLEVRYLTQDSALVTCPTCIERLSVRVEADLLRKT